MHVILYTKLFTHSNLEREREREKGIIYQKEKLGWGPRNKRFVRQAWC